MNRSDKRPLTPTYVVFYILFSPDAWQVLIGVLLALFFTPHILPPDLSLAGHAMLYIMVAAIGWALSARPANWMTTRLKKIILGKS